MYDHPFQWGSKRTGPDLARIGAKRDEAWHWLHMRQPTSTSQGSIMPGYPWMYSATTEPEITADKMRVMKKLGVPYTDEQIGRAVADYKKQADEVVAMLQSKSITDAVADREIIALIAYLRRLGNNLIPAKTQPAAVEGGK